MESIEMTGKTVDEALEIALRELDADRGEVEIDVISRGKSGMFGIGSEPAKIKVTKLSIESNDIDSPDIVTVSREVINNLISNMGVNVICNLRQSDSEDIGGPVFEIEGDDSGLLIGRKGETLRSLQFLVRYLVRKKTGQRANLSLDVEGYDERRRQSLSNLANRVSQRVVKTGRSIELEPMNARERRVVHMALSDRDDVFTESSGSGEDRRVVISPS